MSKLDDILANITSDLTSFVLDLPCVTSKKNIPHKPGVYFLVNKQEEFIYIGQSKNLYKRWQQRKDFALQPPLRLYLLCGYDFHLKTAEAIFVLLLTPHYNHSLNLKLLVSKRGNNE